jgi:fused signal recognition particle receptor
MLAATERLDRQREAARAAQGTVDSAQQALQAAERSEAELRRQSEDAHRRRQELQQLATVAEADAQRLEQDAIAAERDLERHRSIAEEQSKRVQERSDACERLRQAVETAERALHLELETHQAEAVAAEASHSAQELAARRQALVDQAQAAAEDLRRRRAAAEAERDRLAAREAQATVRRQSVDQELGARVQQARALETEARERSEKLRKELDSLQQGDKVRRDRGVA